MGLIHLRSHMHTNVGFDRLDDQLVTDQIHKLEAQMLEQGTLTDEVKATLQEADVQRKNALVQHMEMQLSNRIKVIEMAEKEHGITEEHFQEMFQKFISKQMLLLNKLEKIRKTLGLQPPECIRRTPGGVIRDATANHRGTSKEVGKVDEAPPPELPSILPSSDFVNSALKMQNIEEMLLAAAGSTGE